MNNQTFPFALVIKVNHPTIVDLCNRFGKSNPHITIAVGDYNDMFDRYNLLSEMISFLNAKTNNIEVWNDKFVVLKLDITSFNQKYSLEKVWHKQDYPIHVYGINPHITLSNNFNNVQNVILPQLDEIALHFNQEDLDIVRIKNI